MPQIASSPLAHIVAQAGERTWTLGLIGFILLSPAHVECVPVTNDAAQHEIDNGARINKSTNAFTSTNTTTHTKQFPTGEGVVFPLRYATNLLRTMPSFAETAILCHVLLRLLCELLQ